ncbi:uncharacterized protein CBL_13174 [Carabus blaptoides fortunei]
MYLLSVICIIEIYKFFSLSSDWELSSVRRAQQSFLPTNDRNKKDTEKSAEDVKTHVEGSNQESKSSLLRTENFCTETDIKLSTNLIDGEIEYSVAKCSSVPNIHIKCKPETDVPELFVINTQASSCTDKTESTVASNEDLISKGNAMCTKNNLKATNVANSSEVTQGNSSSSCLNVGNLPDTNVNRRLESKNSSDRVSWMDKNKDHEQEELLRASEVINRRNKRIMKQSFNTSDMLIISDSNIHNNNVKKKDINTRRVPATLGSDTEPAVDCWEDLLNENDPIHAGVTLEMSQNVENLNLSPNKDTFHGKEILEGDLCHVLEIYDFSKEFQTRDLVSILDSMRCTNYHIKWVDDNHALAVFTSGFAAGEFVQVKHPLIKIRAFADASEQSISKAKRYPNAMMPFASRPQTCPQTARRMVSGALGLKLENSREERAKEIKILKEAREKKKLNRKLQDEAWEGKLPSK